MLLISESRARANIERMADRAQRHDLAFRPHFKTHQSLTVGNWFKDYGVSEIAVTSLRMARAMAPGNWKGITIAMPINPREIAELNELAKRTPITVFVTSVISARQIASLACNNVSCLIELSAGYGRSGVHFQEIDQLQQIARELGERLRGYYVHSGHTYDANSVNEINDIHQTLLSALAAVRRYPFSPAGAEYVIGDTPSCSTQENFTGVTAIGPGNFVYYDLVQHALGACQLENIACCFSAPIVETQPDRSRIILHAGWVQLGKDRLHDGCYGKLARLNDKENDWSLPVAGARLIKLSQEHGTAIVPAEWLADLSPGDRIGILPVHACATVHGALALGEQRIISIR